MKRKKQTAIRDQMLQLSKSQLQELSSNELASLMLALPAHHPLFFDAWAEVERRKALAFEKLPGDLKNIINSIQVDDETLERLVHAADYTRADVIIGQLSEKRGRLN